MIFLLIAYANIAKAGDSFLIGITFLVILFLYYWELIRQHLDSKDINVKYQYLSYACVILLLIIVAIFAVIEEIIVRGWI